MVVLDTHAWLWWMAAAPQLSAEARASIEGSDSVAVATISCWEVGLLAERGRIEIHPEPREWVRLALSEPRVTALPLQAMAAAEAASLPPEFPRDPADRIIYSTARSHGAVLVTADRRIRDFDPRGTLW